MSHLTEDELILHYYGETPDAVEPHLAMCPACREEFRRLQLLLNAVTDPVPERPSNYEQALWARLEPKVKRRRLALWLAPRRWAPALAMCGLLIAAYFAGRYSKPGVEPSPQTASAPQVRERILVVGVSDHLDRSQLVLAEILNQPLTEGPVDISAERDLAGNLVNANRLYRQTAAEAGEPGVASVLDDLERVLIEIAHSPGTVEGAQLEALRQRIEAEGLLFKVRVVGSQLRQEKDRPVSQDEVTRI
jgi:hypothetical protein